MSEIGRTASLFLISGASVIWGFLGLCIRDLSAAGLTSIQMFELRCLMCTVIIAVVFLITDRSKFRVSRRDLKFLVFIGVTKVAADTCYFQAQLMVDLSLAAVLENTEPYFVAIISYFLFRERLNRIQKLSLIVAFVGCMMVSGVLGGVGEVNAIGITVGLISGFTFALYTVGVKKVTDNGCNSGTILFYIFLVSSVCTFPFCDPVSMVQITFSDTNTLYQVLMLGIVFTLIPYYMHALCLKGISATMSSVVLFLEVVMCAIVGALFFGEIPTVITVIGMVLVFIGILMINREDSHTETSSEDNVHRST